MTCPTCGSDCYDNTAKVAGGWKGPLAKCKNPECDFRKWPPKGAKAASPRGAKWTWGTLSRTYARCFLLAEKHVGESSKRTKKDFTMADLLASTATLLIAADRGGMQEAAPKAAEEPLDQRPAALAAVAADDDDLPF